MIEPASAVPAQPDVITILADVQRIGFNKNGTWLLGAGRDGAVRIWTIGDGKEYGAPLTGHTGPVTSMAFHPNRRWLATGGADGTVRVWDLSTRTTRSRWSFGSYRQVRALAFSPDGQRLATALDDDVYIWQLGTAKGIGPLPHNPVRSTAASELVFSPDGKILVAACAHNVALAWSATTGERVGAPMFHSGPALGVSFSPDGTMLATADGGTAYPVRLWQARERRYLRSLSTQRLPVLCVAFSPVGGLLATGGADSTVQLWDPATGTRVRSIPQQAPVSDVAFSPDGTTVAIDAGAQIQLRKVAGT
jgi:WD40 repeat protein